MTFHPVGQTIGNLVPPLTIANGGTGATTGPAALTGLGAFDQLVPSDLSLLDFNMPDTSVAASTSILIAGTQYLNKFTIRTAVTITNLAFIVSIIGSNTGGSTGTFVGLYNSSGTLLSGSSDCAATLSGSTGLVTVPLTTPQPVAAGSFVWACIMTNLGTTQPTLAKSAVASQVWQAGLTVSTARWAVNGTVRTTLQSPLTPASNTTAGAFALWCGYS